MKKYTLWVLLMLYLPLAYTKGIEILQSDVPSSVSFAQPFTAQAVLSHPEKDTVQPIVDSTPAEFAITHVSLEPVAPNRTQVNINALPLTLNKSTFTISFALRSNPQANISLETPITITPVQLFKDQNLKEIRSPKTPVSWLLWLCILFLLAILICLLAWWIRRLKKNAVLLTASQDKRPAHIIALSQIDALVDSGLWENKQYKLFYITLTDILRTYLQKAFNLDVSADTSTELLHRVKTQGQLVSFVQQLRAFLASGDLVKFAKVEPTEVTRNHDITFLRQFITQTAPKPQKPEPQQVEVKL